LRASAARAHGCLGEEEPLVLRQARGLVELHLPALHQETVLGQRVGARRLGQGVTPVASG
jgi:hypothetical protein